MRTRSNANTDAHAQAGSNHATGTGGDTCAWR
jgi:hypothetical protein